MLPLWYYIALFAAVSACGAFLAFRHHSGMADIPIRAYRYGIVPVAGKLSELILR